ncbi:hypothetical protein CICLE_v10026662mg [Citrus x clementina]|uniref:Uncharacterized protein n=2 Tax=Citrus TaxID=2706 RepID=V4RXA7_CITCL|nr:hypothetical protein CICLE_v10026662mg [Citrus x clementina]
MSSTTKQHNLDMRRTCVHIPHRSKACFLLFPILVKHKMAALKHCFLLSMLVALSLSSFEMSMAARNLLQAPAGPLPTLPPMPKVALPPMPSIPTLPQATLPPLPTLPNQPTLPKLPTLPPMPAAPKLTLPPLPSNPIPTTIPSIPNIPSTIPTIPFLSPPPSN